MNLFNNFNKKKSNKNIISSDTSFSRLLKNLGVRISSIEDLVRDNIKGGMEVVAVDGYINGGVGQIIDLTTNEVVEEFVTSYNGVYVSEIPLIQMPEVFKIIIKGGVDISTNENINSTITIIESKSKILNNGKDVVISPLTTMYSELAEKIIEENNSTSYIDAVNASKTKLAEILPNLDISKFNDDYIETQDINNSLYAVQLFATSRNISNSLQTEDVQLDEFDVIKGIVKTINDFNNSQDGVFNLTDEDTIGNVITDVIENTPELVVEDDYITGVREYVSTINQELVNIGTNNADNFEEAFSKSVQLSTASTQTSVTLSDSYDSATGTYDGATGIDSIVSGTIQSANTIEVATISKPVSILQEFPIALNTIAMTIHSYDVLRKEHEQEIIAQY